MTAPTTRRSAPSSRRAIAPVPAALRPGPEPGADALLEGLQALAPEHRQVLVDTWLSRRSVAETAAAQGVPASTVMASLHACLRAVAGAYGGDRAPVAGAHVGVAAYALGLLDGSSHEVFVEHLSYCDGCAAELKGLQPALELLDEVDRYDGALDDVAVDDGPLEDDGWRHQDQVDLEPEPEPRPARRQSAPGTPPTGALRVGRRSPGGPALGGSSQGGSSQGRPLALGYTPARGIPVSTGSLPASDISLTTGTTPPSGLRRPGPQAVTTGSLPVTGRAPSTGAMQLPDAPGPARTGPRRLRAADPGTGSLQIERRPGQPPPTGQVPLAPTGPATGQVQARQSGPRPSPRVSGRRTGAQRVTLPAPETAAPDPGANLTREIPPMAASGPDLSRQTASPPTGGIAINRQAPGRGPLRREINPQGEPPSAPGGTPAQGIPGARATGPQRRAPLTPSGGASLVARTPAAGIPTRRTVRAGTPPEGVALPWNTPPNGVAARHAQRGVGERPQAQQRPRLLLPLAATAALLAAGGAATAGDIGLTPTPAPSQSQQGSPAAGTGTGAGTGAAAGTGRRVAAPAPPADKSTGTVGKNRSGSGTDAVSGVSADVDVTAAPAGAVVSATVQGLEGPQAIRLVAVRGDGATQILATVQVPSSGFGTRAQPDSLTLSVPALTDPDSITVITVETVEAGGTTTPLVRVPL